MSNSENVYLKRTGENKYEIITKDIELIPKVYRLYAIDDVIILKSESQQRKVEPQAIGTTQIKPTVSNPASDVEIKTYIVCEEQTLAKSISDKYQSQIKSGDIVGIKGFDRKYYIYKSEFLIKLRNEIIKAIKDNTSNLAEIASKIGESEDAIRGAVEILKEEGIIYEKSKGNYKYLE